MTLFLFGKLPKLANFVLYDNFKQLLFKYLYKDQIVFLKSSY
jgi:hypothetical protein